MANPLDILGVPRQIALDARTAGDYDPLVKVIEALYKSQVQAYHPDRRQLSAVDPERFSLLSSAMDDLKDPDDLQAYLDMWLDDEDVTDRERAAERRVLIDRSYQARRHLAEALRNSNPLAVLNVRSPVRLSVAMTRVTNTSEYVSVLTGEATASRLVLWRHLQEADDPLFGQKLLTEETRYSQGKRVWYTPYLETHVPAAPYAPAGPPINCRYFWQPGTLLSGVRLVGAVAVRDASQELLRFAESDAQAPAVSALALDSSGRAADDLAWTGTEAAWWLPVMKPMAQPGDFLVLMSPRQTGSQFCLAGQLQVVEPL
jgi:hypothetical protein